MSQLVFHNVRKEFPGDVVAVDGFSLTVTSPTMLVLVGPSGCGKTTLLRMVAGLETLTSGSIELDGERLDNRAPKDRDIAMVFQNYALYPHMTVEQNLSFGLKLRKWDKARIVERVGRAARTLEIDTLLQRKPAELSGGQRQRVALGRAIVREPKVFLFDEPLSNLDARLRADMRAQIKSLYQELGVTSIYVTHDQVEAMTIGERLVVMSDGKIHQVGTPLECYRHPTDTFVASFIGSPAMNLLSAQVSDGAARIGDHTVPLSPAIAARVPSGKVVLGIRPEHVTPADADLRLPGTVTLEEPLGHETLTHLHVAGTRVVARGDGGFSGEGTTVGVAANNLHVFDAESGKRVEP